MARVTASAVSPASMTLGPHRRRPRWRGPTLTALTPRLADSMIPLDELPTAIRYARDRVEDAIKVVVRPHPASEG